MRTLFHAARSISRSKGRNILIAVIVVVLGVSSCLALSIMEAAKTAKTDALEDLSITAQISYDRAGMMQGTDGQPPDRSEMKEKLGNIQELSIDEMQTYAAASSVQDFYYTISASMDGSSSLSPVDTTGSSSDSGTGSSSASSSSADARVSGGNSAIGGAGNGAIGGAIGGGMRMGKMGTQGDFTVIGYSSDSAMTDFVSGTSSITDGSMFEEGTSEAECVVSEELATLNDLAVGDTIKLVNPNDDDVTFKVKVVGIYSAQSSQPKGGGMMFSAGNDPANQILMSSAALDKLVTAANKKADDDDAIRSQTQGTYTFASLEDYEAFEDQAHELGLSDEYTVSSQDVSMFEQSLVPLETLGTIATYFLAVVLVLGGIVLVVFNIFSIRERKYEVGVMMAIGMKKGKIASQFVSEAFMVTFAALLVSVLIAAPLSVPVTNSLLEAQTTAQTQTQAGYDDRFGRDFGGGPDQMGPGGAPGMPGDNAATGTESANASGDNVATGTESASSADEASIAGTPVDGGEQADQNVPGPAGMFAGQVSSAMDFQVVAYLLLIGLLLCAFSSAVSVVSIMRYDPVRILSERE